MLGNNPPTVSSSSSPLSVVFVGGVSVSLSITGSSLEGTLKSNLTIQSSVTSTVPTSFPSASVTTYFPFGNFSRSTFALPFSSVFIVTLFFPSLENLNSFNELFSEISTFY